jgi:hypothetical protein
MTPVFALFIQGSSLLADAQTVVAIAGLPDAEVGSWCRVAGEIASIMQSWTGNCRFVSLKKSLKAIISF